MLSPVRKKRIRAKAGCDCSDWLDIAYAGCNCMPQDERVDHAIGTDRHGDPVTTRLSIWCLKCGRKLCEWTSHDDS